MRRKDIAQHLTMLRVMTMGDAAMPTSLEATRARLIGTWQLVSCYENGLDGQVAFPLGENARGQLMYSADGRVAAQLMRANVPRFPNDDSREATPEERARAWLDYFGYFGTFSVPDRTCCLRFARP